MGVIVGVSPNKVTWRVVASFGADGAAARLVPAPGFGALSGSIPGRAFVVHRYRRPLDSLARMKASRGQSVSVPKYGFRRVLYWRWGSCSA